MNRSKLIVGALLLGVAAFGQAQSIPVFKIGVVTSGTGSASTFAAPANAAIDLYEEQLSAEKNLPFKIQFIRYDDASDPTKSVNLVRKLIHEDGAAMILCCSSTPATLAINKVVEDAQTVAISMASSASVVEPVSEKRYTFKTPITDRMMIDHTLTYMVGKGVKNLAFMGVDDSYGEGAWNAIKILGKNKGVEIIAAERFSRSDTNFTPQALKILRAKPDAVYIHAVPPSASLAHEALKRVGYRGPIYHGAGSPTNAFISIGKAAVEGAIVGATPITVYKDIPQDTQLGKSIRAFVDAYEGKYGTGKAEIFATQGYDAAGLAVDAIKRYVASGKRGDLVQIRRDLRDELEQTREYSGAVGIFNFSPNDHVGLDERTLYLVQVKNGRFEQIKD